MKIGFIGLGKLGLPVALAMEAAGHEVQGFDLNEDVWNCVAWRDLPYVEEHAEDLLARTTMRNPTEPSVLGDWADIVFVAVQTPHQPQFEGITRLSQERADFDYTYLKGAVASVAHAPLVVVISTVLPGTLRREIFPLIDSSRLIYNPFFIAMGTTIPDFRDPEFVLIGAEDAHPGPLRELYSTIHDKPLFMTTIETAELTKMAYNTFIGLKIAFANTMMELCEKTGADVDDLIDALSLADQRIISPAYLRGGMGDGGGCHPRDNIALSWLARELALSYDLFESLMVCREKQTEWLASLCEEPLTVLGKAYKPGTNLTVGSPALLLAEMLRERDIDFEHTDPHVEDS